MEFGFQHNREQRGRMTEFEDGKRLLPKPKPSVELPFDVMVSILIRLPARHLQRMRSVCRSWSLLMSDGHFIRKYSKFRARVTKRPHIVSLYPCSRRRSICKMKFFPEGEDYHHEIDMIRDKARIDLCAMSNSCDGLICVVGDGCTYLLNPSIQKARALDDIFMGFNRNGIRSAGLGFDDSMGEYKVVRLFLHNVGQNRSLGCEVYTVGNLHSPSYWKVIDSPPLETFWHDSPVLVNGIIHWTVFNGPGEVPPEIALSFDVKSEKFDVILHPEGSSRPPYSRVVELGGLLCLACTHYDWMRMDIWALKDYNNREWMRQYIIDLSTIHEPPWKSFAFRSDPVTIHDGKIVFCNVDGRRDYYDPQSKSFVKRMHVSADLVLDTAYTESIVWPVEGSQHPVCSRFIPDADLAAIA